MSYRMPKIQHLRAEPPSRIPILRKYKIIRTLSSLQELADKLMTLQEFAFDTETNGLRAYGPCKDFLAVGISISWGECNNYYIPFGHRRPEDYYNQLSEEEVAEVLRPVFARRDVRLIGWNLKFDMHVMARIGIPVLTDDLWDAMIACWLCDENTPNNLKTNTYLVFGVDQTKFKEAVDSVPAAVKKQFGLKANSKATFDLTLIQDSAYYALQDSFWTWFLYLVFDEILATEKMDKVFYKTYVPFIRTLFEMEERGVTINKKRLAEMTVKITKDMDDLKYKMVEIAGVIFNPSSSQQVAELLFGWEKPDSKNKKTGKVSKAKINWNLIEASFGFKITSLTDAGAPSTDNDTIWNLSRMSFKNRRKQEGVELCKLLMQYKKLDKLNSAFIAGLPEKMYDDGKVHPSFNIVGTDSGRLSCSAPNLQQLPKAEDGDEYQVRSLFIGAMNRATRRRMKIIALDFANLEMRLLAHFSQDKNLLKMFAEDADTHGSTAVNMFELKCTPAEVKKMFPHLRQAAKIINFMLMYGGSAKALYEALKSDHFNPIDLGSKEYLDIYRKDGAKNGIDVAQIYIDKYFATYKGVSEFIKGQKRNAHKNGYVYTLLRRKRRLPGIYSRDQGTVGYCERLSVNSAIQGSAADLTMSAQNRIRLEDGKWLKANNVYMLIQVHDELVFECPEEKVEEAIPRIKRFMEHAFGDNVELNLAMRADADFGDSYQEAK